MARSFAIVLVDVYFIKHSVSCYIYYVHVHVTYKYMYIQLLFSLLLLLLHTVLYTVHVHVHHVSLVPLQVLGYWTCSPCPPSS